MTKKVSKDEALKAVKTITKEISESSLEHEALEAVRTLILWAGDDPEREGLVDTPKELLRLIKNSLQVMMKILKKFLVGLLRKLKAMMTQLLLEI